MKNYQVQTPQNLALSILLHNFSKNEHTPGRRGGGGGLRSVTALRVNYISHPTGGIVNTFIMAVCELFFKSSVRICVQIMSKIFFSHKQPLQNFLPVVSIDEVRSMEYFQYLRFAKLTSTSK